MTTLIPIRNLVIRFAQILKVYTVLALVGVAVVMLAQLGVGIITSIENIALTVAIIFTCTLLILWVLGRRDKRVDKFHRSHSRANKEGKTQI